MSGWSIPDDARELDEDRRRYLREMAAQRETILPAPLCRVPRFQHVDGEHRQAAAIMAVVLAVSVLVRIFSG